METQKNAKKYECDLCDFVSSNKFDFNRHLLTRKHKHGQFGSNMEVFGSFLEEKKTQHDVCNCVFSYHMEADHKDTKKNRCFNEKKTQDDVCSCFINTFSKAPHNNSIKSRCLEVKKTQEHICECGKCFLTTGGLSKHRKKCTMLLSKHMITEQDNNSEKIESKKEVQALSELVIDVVKQNTEFQKILLDQNKQILELTKKDHVIHTNSHNTQNIHNKFNLNVFLNETCKDAMNMSEFIDSVKISLTDIEKVGSLGYVEGISNIILNNLNNLDITKRPIHCSDIKREIIHIKDKNKWKREDDEKPVLTDAIKHIAHKNILSLRNWKEANPDYRNSECKKNDVYMRIVNQSMGACDKEEDTKNYHRIIQKIARETIIAKIST